MKEWWPYILATLEVLYFLIAVLVATKIIKDTRTTSKTLAYILLIIFLPVLGIIIYFVFGINYRKNKFYNFKIEHNQKVYNQIVDYTTQTNQRVLHKYKHRLLPYEALITFLFNASRSPVVEGNCIEVLQNGEEKFKKVFEAIRLARYHVHLEYYIYENDNIGTQLAELLIQKVAEGVEVRFLYDALGSNRIKKKFVNRLKNAGVQIAPVNKIRFRMLANRINYRDHRKIIIVDGKEAFTGGINVSDKYINNGNNKRYWRDTHLYIKGPGIFYLQYLFISNWIFSNERMMELKKEYFNDKPEPNNKIVQIAASGPDTKPSIMYSTVSSIFSAKKRLYITTPYFIPSDNVLLAIKHAALSGVDVRLIVPEISDSKFVNAAAYSYYDEILSAGVRVFLYEKGFIHAKTMIVDEELSMVGTANMDVRSHEMNFEVNAIVYDREINRQLTDAFLKDLENCREISLEEWSQRNKVKIFFEHLARLLSPLL